MTTKLFLHDHPVSSYAQKIRIALREKKLPFDSAVPEGLGSGNDVPSLRESNIRLEVPALEDGDVKIFDSTIIMEYLEDKFPETALLPKTPAARAEARMIEDMVDTTYEAINWGYAEISSGGRAEGALLEKLTGEVKSQTAEVLAWLAEKLGSKQYFHGETFGYADICVAAVLHRSVFYGFGPEEGSALKQWHERILQRESIKTTFAEMEIGAAKMQAAMKQIFREGGYRREYRDHRLEWMVKSGGVDVILEGIKKNSIRFSWPQGKL